MFYFPAKYEEDALDGWPGIVHEYLKFPALVTLTFNRHPQTMIYYSAKYEDGPLDGWTVIAYTPCVTLWRGDNYEVSGKIGCLVIIAGGGRSSQNSANMVRP